jgi:hypothetical protein
MARTSRLVIPYTLTDGSGNATAPVSIQAVSPVSPVDRSAPADYLTVTLSGPAAV